MDLNPSRIQQLPPLLANQIAAGEVIERPASVVKELLENALDSGANTIHIDIGFGGLNQIKISDNGAGIMAEDLLLAIAAHATSKISQLHDLYAITSMGFRGEALASIAAVSRLSLSSKPATQEHAMILQFDGGMPTISPTARSQGTTVEVLDIFYNAPVRKKFLKTARSEYQAIEMVVKRFALSAPTLAITLRHDGALQLALPAAICDKTKLLRIKKLLGKAFVEHAIAIDIEQSGMALQGFISGRQYERSQNDKQWVYINQRMVKDKLINHAIKQAYEGLLHPGRHSACVLYLTIPAIEVDVNVHPTKHEVRFQQPRLVHDFMTSHLNEALSAQPQETPSALNQSAPKSPVRELSLRQPLRPNLSMDTPTFSDWVILNDAFVLLFLCSQPYLVDIVFVEQARLLNLLTQCARPLASRPLLVPVRVQIDYEQFLQCHHQLMQLGFQLEWMGDGEVLMKTMPQLLPQLDIKKLLTYVAMNDEAPTDTALLDLLVMGQSLDARQFDEDSKALLVDYLEQLQSSGALMKGCMRLDSQTCRDLLYV